MAAIDKIYVTKKQFLILEKWYNLMVEEGLMLNTIPFNQYNLELDNWEEGERDKPVWNLDVKSDMWLLSNCPFDFVKRNIMFNYGFDGDENNG